MTILEVDPHVRRVIETDLPAAIERGELFALFQPQVELATRRVVGAEALARWRHPQLGEISPDVFIAIAEDNDQISRVSRFMLDEACRRVGEWRAEGLDLGVSVNVSPTELSGDSFCTDVLEVLRRWDAPPSAVTLEVTETKELRDAQAFLGCIEEARAQGLGISVDDYGRGYASLRRMHELDASEVKLDRSLIKRGLIAEVQHIVEAAHAAGARIVAEGVETVDDLDVARSGEIRLRPRGEATARRSYVPGTNVLRTEWRSDRGAVRVTDALVSGVAGRLPWAEFARMIEGLEGSVEMEWSITPGTALGTKTPWVEPAGDALIVRVGDLTLGVTTDGLGKVEVVDDELPRMRGRFVARAGSEHILVLAATEDEPIHLPDPANVKRGIARTVEAWKRWSREFRYEGPWARQVERSALALKLLIYSPSGAIAAAATTSLPERMTGGKNWDYRFAWVRDLAYSSKSLVEFGLREETHAAISWMLKTLKTSADLEVFYRLDGSVSDGVVEHDVPGWRGIGPVVSGNPARGQLQLGVFGDLFGIVASYVREGNHLDVATGRYLADLADRVCDVWRMRDAGMWELEETQHWTSSKMGCWQALSAAIDLAEQGEIADRVERWKTERDRIRAWVEDRCWSPTLRAYVAHPETDDLDASVLLHAPSGFDRGERMSQTIDAIRERLGEGEQLYRLTGMQQEEFPFTACAFWEATALACVGRRDEATERMDRLVRTTNDVGLMAEMIAPGGEFWGNMPQALSHLALIDAAITIRDLRIEHGEPVVGATPRKRKN